VRDIFQLSPEGIFKAYTSLTSIDDEVAFNERGFHLGSLIDAVPVGRLNNQAMLNSTNRSLIALR
jgi:hypothetical protein